MPWNFEELRRKAEEEISAAENAQALEELRIKYLGRKGLAAEIYASLSSVPAEEKPAVGKGANDFKNKITARLEEKQKNLQTSQGASVQNTIDVTIPGAANEIGARHILRQTTNEICSIFENLGFVVMEGPEIETEFNNFTALNIPSDHPSRDAFDTFYVETETKEPRLLRSHTSPAQARIMKAHKPPLAVIVPGKVYRPDAVDASHSFMFHQIEGLLVDEKVTLSHLKGLLDIFCKKLFGSHARTRFRPHFFPFTEPSAEVDVSCYICAGKGCSVCGRKGWLEIMGCGMVHPKVLSAVGYPKGKYTGLAFGMGVERITMLKHGINDIRIFFENDVRFLNQF